MAANVALSLTWHGHNTLPRAIAAPTPPPYSHQDLTRRIIGAFYAVYNELGYGYVESVYEAALSIALTKGGLTTARQCGRRRCNR